MNLRKVISIVLIIAVIIFAFINIDIQQAIAFLQEFYKIEPLYTFLLYILLYIISTVIGLPSAAILSISAGFMFGFPKGLLIVSISSGLSAILSFLLARYFIKKFAEAKFPKVVDKINLGMEKDGAFYILFLRMVPVIPFPILNMSFGLTKIKIFKYWWVSQLAMIPLSAMLVNAGTGVTDLTSTEGVFTSKLIGSLLFISLLPLVFKFIYAKIKN